MTHADLSNYPHQPHQDITATFNNIDNSHTELISETSLSDLSLSQSTIIIYTGESYKTKFIFHQLYKIVIATTQLVYLVRYRDISCTCVQESISYVLIYMPFPFP